MIQAFGWDTTAIALGRASWQWHATQQMPILTDKMQQKSLVRLAELVKIPPCFASERSVEDGTPKASTLEASWGFPSGQSLAFEHTQMCKSPFACPHALRSASHLRLRPATSSRRNRITGVIRICAQPIAVSLRADVFKATPSLLNRSIYSNKGQLVPKIPRKGGVWMGVFLTFRWTFVLLGPLRSTDPSPPPSGLAAIHARLPTLVQPCFPDPSCEGAAP